MPIDIDRLIENLEPDARQRVEARAAELIEEELTLRDLRKARKLTQEKLAERLGVSQDKVSRMEKRSDLLLSTLRRTVEGMGGRLSLVAEFPDRRPVVVSGLGATERKKGRRSRPGRPDPPV